MLQLLVSEAPPPTGEGLGGGYGTREYIGTATRDGQTKTSHPVSTKKMPVRPPHVHHTTAHPKKNVLSERATHEGQLSPRPPENVQLAGDGWEGWVPQGWLHPPRPPVASGCLSTPGEHRNLK